MFDLIDEWKTILSEEFDKPYFVNLTNFLQNERKSKSIYPDKNNIFNALNLTSFASVKVVIIGQDPYHQKGQAHGLSFSVQDGVKIPPSLKNIYKELNSDLNCYVPNNGNLIKWARQGVLLLNSVLTVEANMPNSHKNLGWENFTLKIVQKLNVRVEPVIFLLWGANAKYFEKFIDKSKHFVLTTVHPSPLSAYGGFLGCKHFSKTNELLKLMDKQPIDWQIENI
ncbi:MAG: uracil-DNA glycosylase [Clostridia bacterium]|nr:uracil-DNA glycosylase [Clostridia bacterium]